MISRKLLNQTFALLVSIATIAAPLAAQQRVPQQKPNPAAPAAKAAPKPAVPEQPALMIDSLLAADSYKVYGEVKNVGTLVHTGAFAELIDPVMKLADPPREFKALVKFLNANAEPLANSKLVFATWPARAGIPKALFVIELESAEEAAKFEPKLNRILPVILPTPEPTPTPSPSGDRKTTAVAEAPKSPNEAGQTPPQKSDLKAQPAESTAKESAPPPPQFVVSRSGNLVFVTDKAFKFDALRPPDSKLLNEDQNFRQAHERFSTEPVFVFINVVLPDISRPQPSEADLEKEAEAQRKAEAEAEANEQKPDEMNPDQDQPPPPVETPEDPPPTPVTATVTGQEQRTAVLSTTAGPAPTPNPQQATMMAVGSLMSLLTGGEPEWPDAVGIAIAQESDDYVIRSILVGPQNGKRLVVPFVPQLFAGQPYTPNAPSVLPDETELLVSASFDWSKTYQEMLARLEISNKERIAEMRKVPIQHRADNDEKPYDPFTDFEKKGGFKIKDDLLPALGNEIAIAGSMKSLQGAGPFAMIGPAPAPKPAADDKQTDEAKAKKKEEEQQGGPMVLIGVRDREAAKRLMPKILEGLGVGAANMLGTTVKRDDTEMVDFAGAFAYAFIGDFLVISTTATVRHVIDSHINHQTLASNSAFRNFTRWQPREIVGQIYVSPALMESYQKAAHDPSQTIAAAMREYLLRLNPTPQAITYALSNEGFGAIHELHLPKSFVLASVAGAASATKEPPPEMNEAVAQSLLRVIASAEATYKETTGKGSYGSLDKLAEAKLISSREMFTKYGYRIEVTVSGNQFEATATPVEYGKTGRISYFVDQSGVVRGGDHGGSAASASDKPMQ